MLALRPYPSYRDPGVPWLDGVPEHWAIGPGFAAYREKQQKNTGMAETQVLSLSYGKIIVKSADRLHGLVPASFETYQVVNPGEIIIRPTDLQNDTVSLRIGLARDRGIITSAYMCLKTVGDMTPDYGYLLLHAYDLQKVLYGLGSGLRQNLDFSDLKRLPVLVPPPDEQAQIAAFLSQFDRRISRLIRVKRRMIELLNEQKQAIIHRAVTCGLNPNVPLKPSGIDWLGDVPEHWTVMKLGRIAKVANGSTPSRMKRQYWEGGDIPWLASGKVNDYVVTEPSEWVTPLALKECSIPIIPRGSVIMGMIGQGRTRGMCAFLSIDACINQNLAALMPRPGLNGHYLHYALTTLYRQIREHGRGSNQEALNCEIVSSLRIALPALDEQNAIVGHLDHILHSALLAIQNAVQQIDRLREYRTRLVADVVTGKLDVRGVELSDLDEDQLPDGLELDEDSEAEDTDDNGGEDDVDE